MSDGILIIVMSSLKFPWRSQAINATWNRDSQTYITFTESNRSYYEASGNDHFEYLEKIDTTSQWIVLVDDDTYMNIPNLKKFINKLDPKKEMLIGHVLTPFNCLWGGAGMILSRPAYLKVKEGMRRHIKKDKRRRNDVIMFRYAEQLNIPIFHTNLLWGNSIPEASNFVNQMKNKYSSFESAISGTISLHKMCPDHTCKLMYDAHAMVSKKKFNYDVLI